MRCETRYARLINKHVVPTDVPLHLFSPIFEKGPIYLEDNFFNFKPSHSYDRRYLEIHIICNFKGQFLSSIINITLLFGLRCSKIV